MMSKTPFMPLWVSDFLGDTLDLDAKEIGAYMLILMSMWKRGGPLPYEEDKLKRIARVGRDWPRVWATLERFFIIDGGEISNKRLMEELLSVTAKREVNAQNGARGGRAKALKEKEARIANATNSPQQSEPYLEKKEEANASSQKGGPKKGTRIAADWRLSKPLGEWAVEQGMTESQARAEADKFRDYWLSKPGASGVKLDWAATWRNWVRKAIQDRGQNVARFPSKSNEGRKPHWQVMADREAASARRTGGAA